MTSDNHAKTRKFLLEAAAFDCSAEQANQLSKKYNSSVFTHIRHESLSRFSKDEMINIVKAICLFEKTNDLNLGSCHPAINIINQIREVAPDDCDLLDKWILENTEATYLPWGFHWSRHFKSWAEVQQRDAKRARKALIQEKNDALARKVKVNVEVIKAQRNIFNAIRRKDLKAIEAMIAKGVDLDKPNDEGKSPRAYAEELGDEKVLELMG